MEELSDEERQRFREAVNEVWHAEEVERRRHAMHEANLAYRRALHREVRKLDVSEKIQSVLLRLLQLRFDQEVREPDGPAVDVRRGPKSKPSPRTEADRRILNAARLKADAVAAVAEAKNDVDQAVTAREKNAASRKYREVMRREMIRADPRVEPLLRSLEERRVRGPGDDAGRAAGRGPG